MYYETGVKGQSILPTRLYLLGMNRPMPE